MRASILAGLLFAAGCASTVVGAVIEPRPMAAQNSAPASVPGRAVRRGANRAVGGADALGPMALGSRKTIAGS